MSESFDVAATVRRNSAALALINRRLELVEEKFTSTNTPMVAALDDIRAIVFGRGDGVTKVQKVQDRITRLNVTKA